MVGGNSVFWAVPYEGWGDNWIHCVNGERRETDKGMRPKRKEGRFAKDQDTKVIICHWSLTGFCTDTLY
jgi:hypothetical protein